MSVAVKFGERQVAGGELMVQLWRIDQSWVVMTFRMVPGAVEPVTAELIQEVTATDLRDLAELFGGAHLSTLVSTGPDDRAGSLRLIRGHDGAGAGTG